MEACNARVAISQPQFPLATRESRAQVPYILWRSDSLVEYRTYNSSWKPCNFPLTVRQQSPFPLQQLMRLDFLIGLWAGERSTTTYHSCRWICSGLGQLALYCVPFCRHPPERCFQPTDIPTLSAKQ